MKFNTCLRVHTSHHGPPYPFKDARLDADSLTGIHNAMVKWLFVVKRSCNAQGFLGFPTAKNAENSNLMSVEAMQWDLLYLSIGHYRSYCEHLAQHGKCVPEQEHHNACTTFFQL
jgi:hypothetical protein